MFSRCIIGLDLGQLVDPSAMAILRMTMPTPGSAQPQSWQDTARPVYIIPALKRWPLRTSYLDICNDVAAIVRDRCRYGPLLMFDRVGVGNAVFDLLGRALRAALPNNGWQLHAVVTTGGQSISQPAGGGYHVAKTQLVSIMQAVLQTRRLKIAAKHPEAETLRREFTRFRLKVTATGAETFGAKGKDHDDVLFALMLAVFGAEQALRRA